MGGRAVGAGRAPRERRRPARGVERWPLAFVTAPRAAPARRGPRRIAGVTDLLLRPRARGRDRAPPRRRRTRRVRAVQRGCVPAVEVGPDHRLNRFDRWTVRAPVDSATSARDAGRIAVDGSAPMGDMPGDKPLAGLSALVTGGGGGIGRASAAWLARDGAAVTVMGRTEATLLDAQREIREFAGADPVVEPYIGDALDEAQPRRALQAAASLTGRLAIAVAVVGGGTMKPLVMFEPQDVMDDLQRNILSAFLV